MPYRLEAAESIPDALRRVAAEELSSAMRLLDDDSAEGRDKRVHEARKSMKKLRALLRVARAALPPATYRHENVGIRDTGRLLSGLRASAAGLEAFEVLVSDAPATIEREAIAAARRRILQAYAQHTEVASAALPDAAAQLAGALGRVAEWEIAGSGWTLLRPGLRAIYARGRRAYKRAAKLRTTEALHDWRKQVKYLWYSVRLLEPCWPRPLKALAAELAVLGEVLGDDHDLAELEPLLSPPPPEGPLRDRDPSTAAVGASVTTGTEGCSSDQPAPTSAAAEGSPPNGPAATPHEEEAAPAGPVLALTRARREALQAQALRLGKRLYAERPARFTLRLGAYFNGWRRETRAERGASDPAEGK